MILTNFQQFYNSRSFIEILSLCPVVGWEKLSIHLKKMVTLFLVIYGNETILEDFSRGSCFKYAGSFSVLNSKLVNSILKARFVRILCQNALFARSNHTKPKLTPF